MAGLVANQGPVADCLHHGGPVSVPDVTEQRQRWPQYATIAHRYGARAVRALPIGLPPRSGTGGPIGVLALFTATAGPIAASDLVVAQSFTDLAAVALSAGDAGIGRERAAPGNDSRSTARAAEEETLIARALGVISEQHGVAVTEARGLLDGAARSRDLHPVEMARAVLDRSVRVGSIPTPGRRP